MCVSKKRVTNPFSSSVPLRGFKITLRTTASNLRHEPPCTRVHYPAFFFPSSREILLSTIRRFVPFSFPTPLLFPLQLIFLSRALDFLPREPFGLLPPGIFLPVGPASRHFGRTNYCFPSYFAPAMHRRDSRDAVAAACSCAAVIFDHVEQRARGSRRMLPRLFVRALSSSSSPSRPPHLSSPLLFCASVSHVCAFRVHGYLECTPCPEALRDNGVCRVIFVYAGSWTIPSYVMLFEAFVPFFIPSSLLTFRFCNLLSPRPRALP